MILNDVCPSQRHLHQHAEHLHLDKRDRAPSGPVSLTIIIVERIDYGVYQIGDV